MTPTSVQPNWVLAKTAKGRDEVHARALGIPPGIRRLLILADGQRQTQDLVLLAPDAQAARSGLEWLIQEGLLEPVAGTGHDATSAVGARARLLRLAAESFPGHERLIQKLQAAEDDPRALAEVVDNCTKFIRLFIDQGKATTFERQARAMLDGPAV